ncbi:MAG: hypothetical protein LBM93_10535 [Oscillospiraceae bacterium]|jgi:hypothetical protein|nr:hypothetical protein [Oscillospiraceae bacterium]
MATATLFKCASCGSDIPISNINSTTNCPYCHQSYWIDEDFEEQIKTTIKNTGEVLVNNVRDISIPDVKNQVLKKDLIEFMKINQSIAMLLLKKDELDKIKTANDEKIAKIESSIGLDYSDLPEKTISYKSDVFAALFLLSYILGIVFIIISGVRVSEDVLSNIVVTAFWPILVIASLVGGAASSGSLVLCFLLSLIPVYIYIAYIVFKKKEYSDYNLTLDDKKRELDLTRINDIKKLIKMNFSISQESELLNKITKEITQLRGKSPIYKVTRQLSLGDVYKTNGAFDFFRISELEYSISVLAKIDYALWRMEKAPIEFEVACSGFEFNRNKLPSSLEFQYEKYTNECKDVISFSKKCINHITN